VPQGSCVPTVAVAPGGTPFQTPLGGSSGNVAAATATATLTATTTRTAYLAGFQFTSSGATAASVVTCTITGLAIGTLSYTVAVVAGVNQPLIVSFVPPQAASPVNQNIVASCPSLGTGNTNAAMSAQGYLQ
jgi:hypothetical protein